MPTVIIHCWSMLSAPRLPRDAYSAMYAVAIPESAPMATPIRVLANRSTPARGQRGQDRADRIHERVDDEQPLAAEAVGHGASGKRAGGRSQRRSGDQVAQAQPGQVVRHEVERRPDVRRVIAEEEAADGRQQRQLPVNDVGAFASSALRTFEPDPVAVWAGAAMRPRYPGSRS